MTVMQDLRKEGKENNVGERIIFLRKNKTKENINKEIDCGSSLGIPFALSSFFNLYYVFRFTCWLPIYYFILFLLIITRYNGTANTFPEKQSYTLLNKRHKVRIEEHRVIEGRRRYFESSLLKNKFSFGR